MARIESLSEYEKYKEEKENRKPFNRVTGIIIAIVVSIILGVGTYLISNSLMSKEEPEKEETSLGEELSLNDENTQILYHYVTYGAEGKRNPKYVENEEVTLTSFTEEEKLYNQRHAIGQIADQKQKFANEMIEYKNMPDEPVSAADLIKKQQDILARNGENQRKREQKERYEFELLQAQTAFETAKAKLAEAEQNAATARKSAENLVDESTAELEKSIDEIDEINRKIRANLDKAKADEDAKIYAEQYADLTNKIESLRKEKYALLNNAELPLPGLSVQDKELTYNGYKWDNMSGSEQMKVATAIIRKLNPNCGFVLLDKLEQMDVDTLSDFNNWLEKEGLQAIATRVSNSNECSIIIEDGYVKKTDEQPTVKKEWKTGVF